MNFIGVKFGGKGKTLIYGVDKNKTPQEMIEWKKQFFPNADVFPISDDDWKTLIKEDLVLGAA